MPTLKMDEITDRGARWLMNGFVSDTVDRYKDTIDSMPPIKVVHMDEERGETFGEEYIPVDGFHLYQALKTLERTTAEVDIVGGEIADLGISLRTLYALVKMANYQTVEQVRAASNEELLAIHDFGDKSLYKIREALNQTEMVYNPAYDYFTIDRMKQFRGLCISGRTQYALATSIYSTIEQVRMASNEELLSIRAFGINSLHEVRYALTLHSEI
jgi:DNA-directed RNA polymerase alpha subunit